MTIYNISMQNPTEYQTKALVDVLNEIQDAQINEIESISKELNVSFGCASDISYLRSRNRWTEELERKLIEAHKNGIPVNIFEFGVTKETQKALMDQAMNELEQRNQVR